MLHYIFKPLLWLLGLYTLFALIGSTVPWLEQKEVTGTEDSAIPVLTDFFGTAPGPDRVRLAEDPADAFNIRIQMLRRASRTLDITYHTMDSSDCMEAFLGETLLAADRGVKIRIMLDGKVGAAGKARKSIRALAEHENISIRLYNPFHLFQPWKWHCVLHDKFIVTDQTYALLGGRNIGERYYAPRGYKKEVTNDRDIFVWNTAGSGADGSGVTQITAYMDLLWESPDTVTLSGKTNSELLIRLPASLKEFETDNPQFYQKNMSDYKNESLPANKVTLVYNPIHTGPKEPVIGFILKELALLSSQEVLLQTPYATANKHLLTAMEEISANTELNLVTNSLASSPNFPAYSNYHYNKRKFLKTGANLWEYQSKHSIHGKSAVIDNRLSAVGSYNMDDRSFYIDTETMLIVDSPEFARVLTSAIRNYQDQALMVGEDSRYLSSDSVAEITAPPIKKAIMFLASVFSRLFQFLI